MKKTFLLATLILSQLLSFGQNSVQEKAQTYRKANEHQLLQEFMGLLSIPNVVYDTVGIQKTAAYIAKMMENNGIKPQFLEGKTKGVPPAIFGEINTPNAKKTIIFYAHYDGQPVNPNPMGRGNKTF
jgi:acetylornithine deacetylase/succinyl-diaminopimelate desuccinylase-like protein